MARGGPKTLRSLMAGAVVVAFGIFVAAIALTYPLGSAFRPGPGFVPLGVGLLLVALGLCVALEDWRAASAGAESPEEASPVWRPMLATVAALLVFALLLDRVGFVPAAIVLVLIAARGEPGRDWRADLALGIGMAAFGTAVFIWGLGLPIDPVVGL